MNGVHGSHTPMSQRALDSPSLPILVVERDAALRTLFTALLTREGYRVDCVCDVDDALSRITRTAYAVIVLDVTAADGGTRLLRRLAAAEEDLLRRTIVTTGMTARELARFDSSAAFALVQKPFDISDLVAKVHECANRRESRRPHRAKAKARQLDDEREARLTLSMRRFAAAIPELSETFQSSPVCDGEAMLRGELRRVAGELASVLSAAAAVDTNTDRARRYALLGRNALRVARPRVSAPADEQQH
jgi:DNA-binding NtrC family response regulator